MVKVGTVIVIIALCTAAVFTAAALVYSSLLFAAVGAIVAIVGFVIFWLYERRDSTYSFYVDPKATQLRAKLQQVFPNDVDWKKVQFLGSNKSFTLNKEKVHLCLLKGNGEYYDDNSLMHVAIHELAHMVCDERKPEGQEHTPEFERILASVTERAAAAGIYDPSIPLAQKYCGYN